MRIRTIKPEFFVHEGLFDLEAETGLPVRLAFAGLWCAADREGRFKWEPRRLGVQILPYDKADFSRVLDALFTRGFIRRYRVDDRDFGVIPSFPEHQVINNREKDSELPEPLEYLDPDACLTRGSRVPHAASVEGKGREGKGKVLVSRAAREKNQDNSDSLPPSKAKPNSRDEFDGFFRELGLYPRDAEYGWCQWEGNGWQNGKFKIKDWRLTVRKWRAGGFFPSQKSPSDYESDWPSARTATAEPEEDDLMASYLRLKAQAAREAAGDHPDFDESPATEIEEEAGCF